MKNSRLFLPSRFLPIAVFGFLVFLGATGPVLRAQQIIHVYLIGGQSNADGRAKTTGLSMALQSPQASVPFYYGNPQYSSASPSGGNTLYSASGLISLQPSTSGNPSGARGFGPEITFGSAMAAFYGSTAQTPTVALLKYAAGGTNLYADWKGGGDATTTGDGSTYTAFQQTIFAGMAALKTAYPNATLVINGMLWVQGESDIDATLSTTSGSVTTPPANPNAVSDYAANLTTLITDIRSTFGSNIPFLLSRMSSKQTFYSQSSNPAAVSGYNALRTQQQTVANTVPDTYLINTDGSGFTTVNPTSGPTLHYDAGGQSALGSAFASQAQLLAPEPTSAVLLLGSSALMLRRPRRSRRA